MKDSIMRVIRDISEDVMILEFLKAEIDSPRWIERYQRWFDHEGFDRGLVLNGSVESGVQNQQRRELLGHVRGYRNRFLFIGMPMRVKWKEVVVENDDLAVVRYMNESTWNEISNQTRSLADGAATVKSGSGDPSIVRPIRAIARKMSSGQKYPLIILLAEDDQGPYVLMEGHMRATAHMINRDNINNQLEAIVGISPEMAKWHWY